MKMDRNINADGRGKYALILMRNLPSAADAQKHVDGALDILKFYGMLDYGEAGSPSEFFLIRLKDRFAGDALRAYADAAKEFATAKLRAGDEAEHTSMLAWATAVLRLAGRAGDMSDHCKTPD
jgi:hypothetical protein